MKKLSFGKMSSLVKAVATSIQAKAAKESQIIRKLALWHSRKFWVGFSIVAALLVFGILPAFAAAAPGQIGYTIKRTEETLIVHALPTGTLRTSLQLKFANRRITEAVYVANKANENNIKDQAKTASTINDLLSSYEDTYEAQTTNFNQDIENSVSLSPSSATTDQKDIINAYTALQPLLLQAPDASQLAVLTAIDDTQQHIATLSDIQGSVPLSASDFSQLSKMVSSGVLSQADVDKLTTAKSSRQLHAQVVTLIENGLAPSDLSYILDLDLVKKVTPANAQVFETIAQFEQLQRISAIITASRPTASQQKSVQSFLASYATGQTVPNNDIYPYVTPIVDGVLLSGQLQINLPSLNSIHMGTDDQALFDSWKAVLDPPNLADTYQKLITGAQNQPLLHLSIMTTTQQELVDAQKAQVAYLVMPPGWSASQLATLSNQLGTAIAEASYQQSNPNTAQELARITTVQQQLQTQLTTLKATYNDNSTKLQTQVNNFTGTPDQLTQLKNDLALFNQSQTTTINNLQTQLTDLATTHTNLGNSIESLRQEQIANLTQLELRSATNAQQLTTVAKAELTTSLAAVNTNSQTLIRDLDSKANALATTNNQAHTQLTNQIAAITTNYQQLSSSVQSQIDAGTATSSQLQTSLTTVQNNLTTTQSQLAGLDSTANALSQLVGQVQTSSAAQVQDLQSKINVVKINAQTTNAVVTDLQNITQTCQVLMAGLQNQVNNLDASQATLREGLTASLLTVQNNYSQLASYTQAQIDSGVATSTQLQNNLQAVQTALIRHTTQLTGLASGNAALSQLVDQVKADSTTEVASLQNQINNLVVSDQTIQTSLATLQTAQTADIAQLSSQLADITVLQTEAAATIAALTDGQTQAQASIDNLTTNFDSLQSAFAASTQTQTAMQATIANQQSEISTLQSQTQTAIATLTAGQTQLTSQLASLAATTTTLSQTVAAVQTANSATQTQLTTLLANPPWALASGAYVTQTQLDSLSATLDTQFAQKSAALDAQFQTYQTQLNATVSQLNNQVQGLATTTANTATTQTSQQAQVNTLNSQVSALQSQVQALIVATTPRSGL